LIETVAVTASTNADMLARAASVAAEGLWLRAERQSAGRGRMGRHWDSPAGNLYASTLVRLRPADPPAASLALVSGLAVAETANAVLPAPVAMLKWPNDVLIAGAKLSGMLLERQGDAVVVGIGINVAHAPALPDRATVSLHAAGASPGLDAAMLIEALAARFADRLGEWRGAGLPAILDKWLASAHKPGTPLRISGADGKPLTGHFAGLTAEGALILLLPDGSQRIVTAGDVDLLAQMRE